jgi:drug/metabolite transporter (DMT)-like permease
MTPNRQTPANQYLIGSVTVVATLIGWSSIPLFLRYFATHPTHPIDPWTSNGWRYGFSALLWMPVVVTGLLRRRLPPGIWKAALVPAAINALGQVCFTTAHYKIEPGLLTFGLRSQIVFVTIGAVALFPAERRVIRSPGFIVGILLVAFGTAGTIVFAQDWSGQATALGVALALASGALFAGYALAVRWFMHSFSPVVSFAIISQYTAAAMVVLMLMLGERAGATALDLPGGAFLLLLASAVIGIALGHVFYYISIARLGVAVSSGVIQLQPFLVAIASFGVFGERLSPIQWAFGVVAVGGASAILISQHRLTKAQRTLAPDEDRTHFEDLPLDEVAAFGEQPESTSGIDPEKP